MIDSAYLIKFRRFFGYEGNLQMDAFEDLTEETMLLTWVQEVLERYLLSDKFQSKNCLFQIPKERWPEIFKSFPSNDPVYYVTLDMEHYNKFHMLIEYLNSIRDTLDFSTLSVQDALEKHYQYISSLETIEEIEVLLKCEDGYKWVELKDSKALEREGYLMCHCAGRRDLSHVLEMENLNTFFLSLRDESNQPCITIEYDLNLSIMEMCQKYNKIPEAKWYKKICNIMNHLHLSPYTRNTVPFNKFEYDGINKKWYYE